MLNVRIASSAGSIISAKQMFGLRKTETIVGVYNVKNWEERAIRHPCLRLSYNSFWHLSLFFRESSFSVSNCWFYQSYYWNIEQDRLIFSKVSFKKIIYTQSFPALSIKICLDLIIVFKKNDSLILRPLTSMI